MFENHNLTKDSQAKERLNLHLKHLKLLE